MSTLNKSIYTSKEIIEFYTKHLKDYGDTAMGVGWKNEEAQTVRFEQLTKVFQRRDNFSVNDFGCGTGAFYNFLLVRNFDNISYYGYDILEEMVRIAEKNIGCHKNVRLAKAVSVDDLMPADYSIVSGVFNVKYTATDANWLAYVIATLGALNDKSKLGFSVNFLTTYFDKEFTKPYLYYADPLFLFDYCKRNFSKNVTLLHDYDLYDFTLIIRR